MDNSSPEWATFRFWNKAGIAFFLGGLSCFALGVGMSLIGVSGEVSMVVTSLFIPCALGVGVSAVRLQFLRCPRCAKFFTFQWVQSPFNTGRKCVHCGLGLYEVG
jgi:uncharacterized membrane protein